MIRCVPWRLCLLHIKGFLLARKKMKKIRQRWKNVKKRRSLKISKGCDLPNVFQGVNLIGSKKRAVKCWVLNNMQWNIIIMTGQQIMIFYSFLVSSWANKQNTFFFMLNCAQDFALFMALMLQEYLSNLTNKSSWAQFKERCYDKNSEFDL